MAPLVVGSITQYLIHFADYGLYPSKDVVPRRRIVKWFLGQNTLEHIQVRRSFGGIF
jgi:hypothetical protein